jgi:hypothetical protein
MDSQTLLTIFVAISSGALVIQAAMLVGIYKAARSADQKIGDVLPKVQRLLETSQQTVEQGRTQIAEIGEKTNQILDSTKRQLASLETVVSEAAERARIQLDRAELVLDDTMNRAQETVAMVHTGILKPLREINAVAVGIRTAFQFFLRGTRPSVAQATHDEEMFI